MQWRLSSYLFSIWFYLIIIRPFNKILTFCQKCIELFEDLEVTVENQRKERRNGRSKNANFTLFNSLQFLVVNHQWQV